MKDQSRKQRPRRSPSERRTLIDRWQGSNLTMQAFCEAENIAVGSFCRWRSEYSGLTDDSKRRGRAVDTHPAKDSSSIALARGESVGGGFVELRLVESQPSPAPTIAGASAIIVRGPTGISAEFVGRTDSGVIDRILSMVVDSTSC